ncbi:hypothetical protein B296_00032574 [Ensete ventricosum]|uniref:Uncharacterized protein n=1 Tax=Ensete ventricosum TaxID=4639 RepID=A0A427AD68_ENSVE|nr:hypothetical protein B296_00032574 [Ensete ventricosum]
MGYTVIERVVQSSQRKTKQSKGMVVSVISRGKDAKRKVAPTGQISRKNGMVLQRENHVQQTAHVEEYLNTITPQSSTDRASDEESLHDLPRELDYSNAHIRLKEPGKLENKAEYKEKTTSLEGLSYPKAKRSSEWNWTRRSATVPQRRIYQLQRKGRRYVTTDNSIIGLVMPCYRKGETSVKSSIPCSYGGRALVMKGAEEVENAKANYK